MYAPICELRRSSTGSVWSRISCRFFGAILLLLGLVGSRRRLICGVSTGGVAYVNQLSGISVPQAWPRIRSSIVHVTGGQSGASSSRPSVMISMRLPPGSNA